MNRNRTGIKAKVLLPIMVIFIASALIISLINYRQLSTAVEAKTDANLELFTDSVSKQIEHLDFILETTKQTLNEKHIALASIIENTLFNVSYNATTEDLQRIADSLDIIELNIADSSGVLVNSNHSSLINIDYKSNDVTIKYMALIDGTLDQICEEPRLSVIGEDMYGETNHYVGIPRSDGNGFIQVGFNADVVDRLQDAINVNTTIQETTLGTNGYGIILSDGEIIVCADGNLTGTVILSEAWYETVSYGSGTAWINFMGEQYYAGYKNIDGITILGLVPEHDYYGEINAVLTETIVFLLGSIVIMIAVLYLVLNRLLSPVKDLVAGLRKIAKGDLKTKIEGTYNDEFDEIKNAVNDMSSNLQAAEEYAKLMLDSGPICSQLWSSDIRLVDCNEAALTLYGFDTKEEYLERWFTECSPEFQPDGSRSVDKGEQWVKKAFKEDRCTFDWMHQMVDGTPIPAEITLVRVKHIGEDVVIGYTRDLREEKRLTDKLIEANKVRIDFLSRISHELLTPMNTIIGMTEIALRNKDPQARDEHLREIKIAGANLLALINDMLDFSENEAAAREDGTAKAPAEGATEAIGAIGAAGVSGVADTDSGAVDSAGSATFTAPDARVLIVDDVFINLKVAQCTLEPYKMKIDLCNSGRDCVELIRKRASDYDLIIMDFMMPDIDGAEATRLIREMGIDIPIVALTANTVQGVKETLLSNGFNDYMAKPIDTDILNTILKKWLPPEKQV